MEFNEIARIMKEMVGIMLTQILQEGSDRIEFGENKYWTVEELMKFYSLCIAIENIKVTETETEVKCWN